MKYEAAMRPGEELDIPHVDAWLKRERPALKGAPKITQYSGGVSNWTYRIEYENEDLILRRPPTGTKAKSAHDMGREFRLQKALKPVFRFVPEMIAYCKSPDVIGDEFYVMQRLEGVIPRKNMPKGTGLSPAAARQLCFSMLDTLISLHQVDYKKAGLEDLGTGAGYTRRQVEGWSKRYEQARTWNVSSGKGIMKWLQSRIPSQEQICITHNDFRLDNLVLDPGNPSEILGVLDWELAALGNPLMDLANLTTYWIQADDDFLARSTRRQPTNLPGMLTRAEIVKYYCDKTRAKADDWAFYEVFGLFRLSAIAQQIYYRYYHRQTRNPAFKNYWIFVNYLHWRCRRAMR